MVKQGWMVEIIHAVQSFCLQTREKENDYEKIRKNLYQKGSLAEPYYDIIMMFFLYWFLGNKLRQFMFIKDLK